MNSRQVDNLLIRARKTALTTLAINTIQDKGLEKIDFTMLGELQEMLDDALPAVRSALKGYSGQEYNAYVALGALKKNHGVVAWAAGLQIAAVKEIIQASDK